MINEKKNYEPDEEITIADIVENEEDKKILEPVKPVNNDMPYKFGYVTVDNVYMRAEPDEDSIVITVLNKGDAVIIAPNGDAGKFTKITAKVAVGYILKSQYEIR